MTNTDLLNEKVDESLIGFLSQTLNSNEFELLPLAGDASNRRYFRVVHNQDSMVLMAWESFEDAHKFPFTNIQSHFKSAGIQVPKILNSSPSLGLILLEDLGDLTLERKFWENQNQSPVLPFYRQAVDELVKIHTRITPQMHSECLAIQTAFNAEKFLWELNYGKTHLIQTLLKISPTEKEHRALDKCFLKICGALDKEPKIVCHRDYHSRNLMIKLGQMRVIDFQDARLGPRQYDLVSLLYDSYVELSPENRQELLNYYLSETREFLPPSFSNDQFTEIMMVQIIQRCFKACGTFAACFVLRDDHRYLGYLKSTIGQVHSTLLGFSEFKEFANFLENHNMLERDYSDICAQ